MTAAKKRANAGSSQSAKNNDASAQSGGVENVDKIRDILFGNQMRDYERKFTRLEERIMKEVTRLREESDKRFDDLETYLNKEVESISVRLNNEQKARSESEKLLGDEMSKSFKVLEQKLTDMDNQFSDTTRELRQQILDQSKILSAEIGKKYDETNQTLERSAEELREEKMDRTALSSLLTELAIRISDNSIQNMGLNEQSYDIE